jgi:hypothetical protein
MLGWLKKHWPISARTVVARFFGVPGRKIAAHQHAAFGSPRRELAFKRLLEASWATKIGARVQGDLGACRRDHAVLAQAGLSDIDNPTSRHYVTPTEW